MGVIWWGTWGGGGHVPPLLAVGGARISDATSPFCGWNKNHVFQYLFAFYGHFYWTYPDHVLTLYPYSDILSIYSIYRIRGNRNQSHNDLHFSKYVYGGGGGHAPYPTPPAYFAPMALAVVKFTKHFYNPIVPPTFSLQMTPMAPSTPLNKLTYFYHW